MSDGSLEPSAYDLLASEARRASFVAIAKRDVPASHWFRLGRPMTPVGFGAALVSWSGSMFEYLMPALIMESRPASLLDLTARLSVGRQIAYGALRRVPWGISESAYNVRDLDLTYQYSNFGVPGLGLERGLGEDVVIAPYATALAAMVDPAAAARNFAELERGLPDFQEQVKAYEKSLSEAREKNPGQLFTGGYYKTIVSGAIAAFGWDMLLMAAANPARMEKVFDSIFRRTQFYMQAWAQTSAEVIIQHDDFVWTSGPFMRPDYYRQVIIPRFAELWKPLHAAGKKVLFCSDGNFMVLAEDIVAAVADGLIFEPCNDFGFLTERFGDCQCLVGSFVDCRDLTFNNWDQVQVDIERTFQALKRCKGAILAVGNHMPANIPHAMTDRYFEMVLPRLVR